jgi:hypothetical protein
MSKPKVSQVKSWYPIAEGSNDSAKLYYADMDDSFIMVLPMKQGYKKKYFYGELAGSDAHRYAYDIHIKEIYK